jgi:ribonuclease T2
MKKTLLLLLSTATLFARYDAMPSMQCEAYNNMKHTKNTHHVVLDTSKEYTVMKSHKGQKLLLIKGEQPAQRWVDGDCFSKTETQSDKSSLRMEAELARLEKEMHETLGSDKKSVPIQKQNKIQNTKSSLRMEEELARLENEKKDALKSDKKKHTVSERNLLALSWHNAFCETHRRKKECKRSFLSKPKYHEKHFVLHGLWPQPKHKMYCNMERKYITMDKYKRWNKMPDIGLSAETKMNLMKVMPGFMSNLYKHEWIKHGSCYGTDAEQYYKDAIALVHQVNDSKVGDFFMKNIGKKVTLKQIRAQFDSSFGAGSGKRVELKCKKGLITELWLHLGEGSDIASMLQGAKSSYSRCKSGRIDRAGFTKETGHRTGFTKETDRRTGFGR